LGGSTTGGKGSARAIAASASVSWRLPLGFGRDLGVLQILAAAAARFSLADLAVCGGGRRRRFALPLDRAPDGHGQVGLGVVGLVLSLAPFRPRRLGRFRSSSALGLFFGGDIGLDRLFGGRGVPFGAGPLGGRLRLGLRLGLFLFAGRALGLGFGSGLGAVGSFGLRLGLYRLLGRGFGGRLACCRLGLGRGLLFLFGGSLGLTSRLRLLFGIGRFG
jgi:hypothetical protein